MKALRSSLSFLLLGFVFLIPSVFWSEDVSSEAQETREVALEYIDPAKTPTLKELQENINFLQQEKKNLEFKWNSFRIGNGNLWDFVKQDLTQAEKENLENIIVSYNEKNQSFESDLSTALERGKDVSELKKQQLLGKQDFYISLLTFIQLEKLTDFKWYVESDILLNEKSKDVSLELEQKTTFKEERLTELEKQAQKNGRLIRIQIQEKMRTQVTQKLDLFIKQEKFIALSNEAKIGIFQRLSERINQKAQELESAANPTHVIDEKISLYEAVQDIIENYIKTWK